MRTRTRRRVAGAVLEKAQETTPITLIVTNHICHFREKTLETKTNSYINNMEPLLQFHQLYIQTTNSHRISNKQQH